jgi:serine/threonine protein kinase/uncharacterized protein YraI
MGDDTLRPGDTLKLGDTLKPGDTVRPSDTAQAGDTVQASNSNIQSSGGASDVVLAIGQTIVLNGKDCTIESRIKTSGEAVVYMIKMDRKSFIFKHYKPDTPLSDTAREVLSRIKNKPHDRIIKIIDFGKYNNHDYEIMEFAEGGTLTEYLGEGAIRDAKQSKNIVKMINEGLQQIHGTYNFIYQDLKPDNILFKDAKKTKLVLADFGISTIMEQGDKKATVVASLTDLYGALELAPKTGTKHVIARPSVDYYSLGITMYEMWLGEQPFKNIPSATRDDMIREEIVVFPPDMPADYQTLIQGLIKATPRDRWGDKEIQLWLDGKQLQQTASKANLDYATEMFNDTENFSSPKELAELMVKYPDQGERILYSGVAASWFENSGRGLRAEEIKEVAAVHAQDKKSGYYTAIYKLDPTREWTSKGGKACKNLEEIAQALTSESAYYMEELKKPNARLYLYLTAVEGANGAEASEHFLKYFNEYNPQHALSLVCLKLQDDWVALGTKKYANPEELTQEKDDSQINLIKKAVMETDSILLVWLSSFYNDQLSSSESFDKLNVTDQFFLLSLFPYLSYKDLDPDWQKNAAKTLMGFINKNPGRADLFEAYAAQGLPLNDSLGKGAENKTPIDYIAAEFKSISKKHGEDTVLNLIRLLVKHGAKVNNVSDTLLSAVQNPINVPLVKLLLELGADKAAMNTAYKDIAKRSEITRTEKEVLRLLNPSGFTRALAVTIRALNVVDKIADAMEDNALSVIFSVICAVGIAIGSWALLGRVFELGFWWSLGAATLMAIGSFLFTRYLAFKDYYGYRPIKVLSVLILTIAGSLCFFNIPKPVYAENPALAEITEQTDTETSDAPSDSGEEPSKKGNIIIVTMERFLNSLKQNPSVVEETTMPQTPNIGDTVNDGLSKIRSLSSDPVPFATRIVNEISSHSLLFIPFALLGLLICSKIRRRYRTPKIIKFAFFCIGCLLIAYVGIKATLVIRGSLTAQTATATVMVDSLNFRSKPSTSSTIIKALKKGETLTVTGDLKNGWAPVKHGRDSGWVSAELISIGGTTGSQSVGGTSSTGGAAAQTSTTQTATEPEAIENDELER